MLSIRRLRDLLDYLKVKFECYCFGTNEDQVGKGKAEVSMGLRI